MKRKKKSEGKNYVCLHCGHITGSNPGMWAHLRSAHGNKRMVKGEDWEYTTKKLKRTYKKKASAAKGIRITEPRNVSTVLRLPVIFEITLDNLRVDIRGLSEPEGGQS